MAPAWSQDKILGAGSEDAENLAAVSLSVRLCYIPESSGISESNREGVWSEFRCEIKILILF